MPDFVCSVSNNSARWSLVDLARWKLVPERFSGGIPYIQRFKDAWVRHNRMLIRSSANEMRFPAELLAGVCWIEVGGDPNFIDRVAYEVRAFDWSGPDWVDRNMTLTKNPAKTSFGSVSIQLRTAAQTLGHDPATMTGAQMSALASCLENDVFNIHTVALHLRQLIDHDKLQTAPPLLEQDAVRVVGARYNRGLGLTLAQIRQNTSYGNFIVRIWPRLTALLQQ